MYIYNDCFLILECLISFFLFFDTKWIHNICCLKLIYCVIYKSFCSITFFHLLESLIIPFFSKLLRFYKIFLEVRFYFGFIIDRIFLITETNNNRIEQDLGNTEDAIKSLNQSVTAFFLVNATCGFAHRDGLIDSPIFAVFLLRHLSIYQIDYNIFQNW